MKYLMVLILASFSNLAVAGLSPDYDADVLTSANKVMQEHLVAEGITLEDAQLQLGYKDGKNKTTFYFMVSEHKGEKEVYKVQCIKERCRIDYH